MSEVDVAILGYGPTGKILARLLLDMGYRVAVIDRWKSAYPLPRAVGYDHEIKRMFFALGLADEVEKLSRPMRHYVWYDAAWNELLKIDETQPSISGGPTGFLFDQPDLERVLEDDLNDREGLVRRLGFEALSIEDTGPQARVALLSFDEKSKEKQYDTPGYLTARFAVGCDGAHSIVREAIGSDWVDLGFDADWLLVDVEPKATGLDIPDAAQWCNPSRPTTIIPSGPRNRRWEFMRFPDEPAEAFASEDNVWRLLEPWTEPDQGRLIRHALYTFRARLARGWRKGRLMIAGDAAHLMPPFLGQGMCAGLRDAWSLSWHLDRVLSGRSLDTLLDAYEAARAPHAEQVIRMSVEMGKIVCITDPDAARARDAALRAGQVPPLPVMPGLTGGVLRDGDPVAGQLMPHDVVAGKRMDDLTGRSFVLLLRQGSHVMPSEKQKLDDLGVVAVQVQSGRPAAVLEETGSAAILVRPDFYAFGSARDLLALPALLADLDAALG